MLKIDLIIPSFKKNPKYQRFQKFQMYSFPSLIGSWFPVWYNKNILRKMGVKVNFINFFQVNFDKLSDIVGFDSRIIGNILSNYGTVKETTLNAIIPILKKIRKKANHIVYFDNGDSSGYTQFEVLPYVDRYFKKQILKDKTIYSKFLYRKRLFTDYYFKNYHLEEEGSNLPLHPINPEFEKKIGISWNFAFKDYRSSNKIDKYFFAFSRVQNLKFFEPNKNRKFIFSANYSIKTGSNIIDFQRKQLLNFLEKSYSMNDNISLGRIPKKLYLKTMRSSKAIFSPFGWGEICYRDFEILISGAALIKPNMDHLETWPNIYVKNKTYIPISWKIEDWASEIPKVLSDENLLFEVAINGQNQYKKYWTKRGRSVFCERFIDLITPNCLNFS